MQQPEKRDRFLNIPVPLRDLVEGCVKDGQGEMCALCPRRSTQRYKLRVH